MERLRAPGTRQELCDVAADAAARDLGLDRAVVICIQEGRPAIISAAAPRDPDGGLLIRGAVDMPRSLGGLGAERIVVRRRRPLLAGAGSPHGAPMIPTTGSYVLAPILEDANPIGILHADTELTGRPIDETDLHTIHAFAIALGMAFERTAAVERAHHQALAVREAAAALESVADGALKPATHRLRSLAGDSDSGPLTPQRLDLLLTRRELEVLEVLATGATNAEIARRLVLSEGTIKSHVKSILRKLHVTNRAQAVGTYMRLLRS